MSDGQSGAPAAASRTCILVLGMHRSGTSALTRLLSLLGAALPKELLPEGRGNEKGHWEPARLVKLHDDLLAEGGSRWDDWSLFDRTVLPPGRLAHYKAAIARIIIEEYREAPLFVVKDPRLCRLMPLWREVLAELGAQARFVILLRNPLEVARSLDKVHGLSPAHVYLLWLRHVLEAERETRDAPRVFVHYRDLLNEPVRIAVHLASQFAGDRLAVNEQNEREIKSWIDPEQRHFASELEQLNDPAPDFPWLKETYEACAALVHSPTDEAAQRRLDLVGTAFETASAAFSPALARASTIAALSGEVAALRAMLAERGAALAGQQNMIAAHDAALKARDERIAALDGSLEALRATIAEQDAVLEARNGRIATLEAKVVTWRGKVRALRATMARRSAALAKRKAKLASNEATLRSMRASTSWRVTAPFRAASGVLRRLFRPISR